MERGLEFYVTLAAVAVGALTWLYKKGSRVWRTVRKLRRSFRDICLNPKSTLDDAHCRQLAIGAMYALDGAHHNGLHHIAFLHNTAGRCIFDRGPGRIRWRRGFPTRCPKFWAAGGASTPPPRPAHNWTTSAKRDSATTGPQCSKPFGSTTVCGRMRCSSSG